MIKVYFAKAAVSICSLQVAQYTSLGGNLYNEENFSSSDIEIFWFQKVPQLPASKLQSIQ